MQFYEEIPPCHESIKKLVSKITPCLIIACSLFRGAIDLFVFSSVDRSVEDALAINLIEKTSSRILG